MSISEPAARSGPWADLLGGLPLLDALPDEVRALVERSFVPVAVDFGEIIFSRGDAADAYYVVAEGTARVLIENDDGEEVSLNRLGPGDGFGEGALLQGQPRSATVRASSPMVVLRLDAGVILAALELYPQLGAAFAADARVRRLGDFLRLHSAFAALEPQRLHWVISRLDELDLDDGAEAVAQGGEPDAVYVVEDGRLGVWVTTGSDGGQPHRVRTLHTGEVFGEMAVIRDTPRTAAVRAEGPARLLRLSAEDFRSLLEGEPAFAERMADRLAIYDARDRGLEAPELPPVSFDVEDPGFAVAEDGSEVLADAQAPELSRRRRRRFPLVRQLDMMDCGAACVAMACRAFGHNVSMSAIRAAVGTGMDGTSLSGIQRGGEEIGLAVRPIKSSPDRLDSLPLPAIVHWGANHWVVLYAVEGDRVRLADPGRGLRRIPREELAREWSGYAALVQPTERLAQAPRGGLDLRWLWPFVRPHRKALVVALALAIVSAALEMLLPSFSKYVVDKAIPRRDYTMVHLIVLGMIGVLAVAVGTTIIQRFLLARMAVKVDGESLDFVTGRMLRLPMRYFETRRTGDLERRISGMRQVRQILVQQGVGAVTAVIQLVVALFIMVSYSWRMALLFLACVPLYGGLMRFSQSRLRPVFEGMEEAYGKYQSRQIDAIKGIETVKAMGAEPGLRHKMVAEFAALQDKMFRADFTMMVYAGLIQTVNFLIFAIFLWFGALQVLAHHLTIGELVSFNALVLLATAPISILLAVYDQMQMVAVLLARLQDVFDQEPEQGHDHSHLQPVETLEGHLRLRRMGFAYANNPDRPVLQDISLDVPPGTTVALVGRSGSGKSTLVKCLAGLLVPTEGSIQYDGVDLRELRFADLRKRIGFVLQEPYLFDDTIAANIALGQDDPDAERVRWAAEVASASEFIEAMPLGYLTRVGDGGLRLSGGQAQRVAIARALYHQPPVLVFDEATSALDTEAERAVKENMDRLLEGRTAFVIAHRLSTIRDADIICVLEGGRLVEHGSHEELMRRQGLYAYLQAQQLEG